MRNNLKNKNTIVGLGAWLLSIASFTAQLLFSPKGVQIMWLSPLGISTLVVFVLGSILICWGIFKKEMRFTDKALLVEKRKQYLPELKRLTNSRLVRSNELAEYAVKLPLKDYFNKYLKNALLYPRVSKPVGILDTLAKRGFLQDNLYYELLKNGDAQLGRLKTQYDLVLAEVDDKKLRRMLKGLWWLEHKVNSSKIFAALSKQNPKVPNNLRGYKIGRIGEKMNTNVLNIQIKKISERIDMLLRGGDL